MRLSLSRLKVDYVVRFEPKTALLDMRSTSLGALLAGGGSPCSLIPTMPAAASSGVHRVPGTIAETMFLTKQIKCLLVHPKKHQSKESILPYVDTEWLNTRPVDFEPSASVMRVRHLFLLCPLFCVWRYVFAMYIRVYIWCCCLLLTTTSIIISYEYHVVNTSIYEIVGKEM